MSLVHVVAKRVLVLKKGITYIERIVAVPNLPKESENTLLIFITDLHFGSSNKKDPGYALINDTSLESIVDEVNRIVRSYAPGGISVDKTVLLFGGDLINCQSRQWVIGSRVIPETSVKDVTKVIELLKSIKARVKVFVVGNHETKHTEKQLILHEFKRAGFVNVEDNNYVKHGGLLIAGVADCTYTRGKRFQEQYIDPVNEKFNNNKPKVIIAHNPMVFDKKHFDLKALNSICFSGHVHGGHIDPESTIPRRVLHTIALKVLQHPSSLVSGDYQIPQGVLEVSEGVGDHPAFNLFGRPTRSTKRTISFTILKRG